MEEGSKDSTSHGGSRKGSGRRRQGPKRHIHIPEPLWDWCLKQPGGAAGYIRDLIVLGMLKKLD